MKKDILDRLHECEHDWNYLETVPFIQGFLQKARQCRKCKVAEYGFGFTEDEIMDGFNNNKLNKNTK